MAEKIKAGVAKTGVASHKGKVPFMGKIIRYNLMNNFLHMVRSHGLYPVLADKSTNYAPVFMIMHHNIVNRKSPMPVQMTTILKQKLGDVVPSFEDVRHSVAYASKVTWPKQVKPLTSKKHAIPPDSIHPSSLTWFFLQYQVWFTTHHLATLAVSPIFPKNYVGSVSDNKKYPLDNLTMTDNYKVSKMDDLALVDDKDNVRSPSNVALAVFKVVNTQLREDDGIKAKRTAVHYAVKAMDDKKYFLTIEMQQPNKTPRKKRVARNDDSPDSIAEEHTPKTSTKTTESPEDNTEELKQLFSPILDAMEASTDDTIRKKCPPTFEPFYKDLDATLKLYCQVTLIQLYDLTLAALPKTTLCPTVLLILPQLSFNQQIEMILCSNSTTTLRISTTNSTSIQQLNQKTS